MTEATRRTRGGADKLPLPGWVGHAVHSLGAITPSDATVYDPPIRLLEIATSGNLCFVLEGDDETDPNARITIAVSASTEIANRAFRQIRATNTTCTLGNGYT